ncbi:hypothetical protein DFH06DRAFT_1233887 [Mycena polygramma]|nr:hypothetical protein DFH06DRAFT_1233887 [Mycena polygramma]
MGGECACFRCPARPKYALVSRMLTAYGASCYPHSTSGVPLSALLGMLDWSAALGVGGVCTVGGGMLCMRGIPMLQRRYYAIWIPREYHVPEGRARTWRIPVFPACRLSFARSRCPCAFSFRDILPIFPFFLFFAGVVAAFSATKTRVGARRDAFLCVYAG